MKFRTQIVLAGLAVLVLSACGSTPKATYYTLTESPMKMPGTGKSPSIAVAPATLPDSVDRPQMVVRTASNSVALLEQHRWADSLRQEISRVVAGDLGRQLDSSRVVALVDAAQAPDADFRVVLQVQRLDTIPGEGVAVDINWQLIPRTGKTVFGRTAVNEPATKGTVAAGGAPADEAYGALVAAHRRAMDRVATEIAVAVKAMPPAPR